MLENTDLQLETQNDFKEEQVSENAQDFEVVEYNHPVHGLFEVEVDTGLSDDQIKKVVGNLDLDLLLGLEQVNETEVGETQVEKLKEFENSAGAGRKGGKWYGHESLEGGTQTIAYGHKLTPEEAKSGFISINGELVDYREGLSQDHAEAVLKTDTQWAQTHASASLKKIGMEDDEGKLQAITSLIYNVGSGSWGSSKAKKFLEAGNIEDFMHEAFSEEAGFVNINGEYSRGLARRRKEEAGLFAQANINEGSPFSKMISEVLNTINPISTAQAADDPKGLPLPTQDEADAATAAAEPSSKFGTPPVKPEQDRGFPTPPRKPIAPRVAGAPAIEPDTSIKKEEAAQLINERMEPSTFFGSSLIPAYGSHAEAATRHMAAATLERMGLPVPDSLKTTIDETSLSPDVLNVTRLGAYRAFKNKAKGGTGFTNYQKDFGDAAKLVYGNLREKLGTTGILEEIVDSFFDPVAAAGLTIGESSNIMERDGNLWIVGDEFNFPKIGNTKGDTWLGIQSWFSDEGGLFAVSPENRQKIEINLGSIKEIEKLLNDQEGNSSK